MTPAADTAHAGVRPSLPPLLAELRAANINEREKALVDIEALAESSDLAANEVTEIIRASSKDLPPTRFELGSYDQRLLRTIEPHLGSAHVSVLATQYPRLSSEGQSAALHGLARIGTEASTKALVALVRRHGWPTDSALDVFEPLDDKPLLALSLVPALFDGSIARFPESIGYQLVLSHTETQNLPPHVALAVRPKALQTAQASIAQLTPLQKTSGTDWRFDETYVEPRYEAGLALDVLGRLGTQPESVAVLREAERLLDPHPRAFAVLSLLRLEQSPSDDALRAVAADPETRNLLFDELGKLGSSELFPTSERTQEKFAESDMVRWLTYPTELGHVPTQIELMKKVERDLGADIGVVSYYVFRFRSDAPQWEAEGWMAGISGPFRAKESPATAGADTFSEFDAWDEATAEEHVAAIEELLDKWRAGHGKGEEESE